MFILQAFGLCDNTFYLHSASVVSNEYETSIDIEYFIYLIISQ